MKGKRKTRATKPRSARKRQTPAVPGRRPLVLDEDLKKLIRQEASQMGLSEEEYLRLVLHFSEAVRSSTAGALPAGLLDGGLVRTILTNPMALTMIKGLIGNVMKRFGPDSTPATPAAPTNPYGPGRGYGLPPGMDYGMPAMPPGPGYGMPMGGPPKPPSSAESTGGGFSLEGLSKMVMQFLGTSGTT